MRAGRLISILMLLQSRGRMSAQALAGELEASVRTIYRDVEQLSASGVPVTVKRGPAGGFELLGGWRTRLTGLTPKEAQAMFLVGTPGPASQLGLGEAMASAQLKLLAALPPQWQSEARVVGTRFHLDPVGWFQNPARVEHLGAIADAVWNERRVKVRYESWKDVSNRVIEPLGLVLKAGEWYVVAGGGKDANGKEKDPRTFRLSSMHEVEVRAERFARPKGFELAKYWAASIARFEDGVYKGTAIVRVSALGEKRLRALSAAVCAAADRSDDAADDDGWRRVAVPIESVEHASHQFLRLGVEGEVISPPELREKLAETARHLAKTYSRPAPASPPRN